MSAPGLDALANDVARSLRYLGDDPPNCVPPRDGIDHDVVVVGAGQSGVAIAFALRRAGITNTLVIDAELPGHTGTWPRHARMRTLRTPKSIPGPELGIPALSFRAWYAAQHGSQAFDDLGRIPLSDWTAYIAWYQQMVRVQPRYETKAIALTLEGDHLRLDTVSRGVQASMRTRKVVLAMGMTGAGRPTIPEAIRRGLPATRYLHTDEVIDFAALAGKRVAVLGAASSAFDAAGVALESGAGEVHLFCRGDDLAKVAREWPLGYPGAGNNFSALPDADRWLLGRVLRARAPGPMPETVKRATCFSNFYLHLGSRLERATERPNGCRLTVNGNTLPFDFDFVIAGTGYTIDPLSQPLLSTLAAHIAIWGDRYSPPDDMRNEAGSRYPYLGADYEFVEREPGAAPWLGNVHCFNFAAIMSFGRTVGDIASLQSGVPRLVAAISRDLFLAERDHHMTRLTAPPPMELTGKEYANSMWRPALNVA
jgi:cation diffusion facilitator CzcD-associated flavoprotein CzcO